MVKDLRNQPAMDIQRECNILGYDVVRHAKDRDTGKTYAYRTSPSNGMGGVGYFTSRDQLLKWIEQVKEIRAIQDSLPPIVLP
jgi:hypothetical protein